MMARSKHGSVLHGRVDWVTIAIALALMALGWMNLYAVVYDETRAAFDISAQYGKQLVWIGVSLVVAIVVMLVDDKYYHILAYPIYIAVLVLMLATLVFGRDINGAKAWLDFGPVRIQPTEFMKFAASLALARAMSVFGFSLSRPGD